jgi:hypothetical protein
LGFPAFTPIAAALAEVARRSSTTEPANATPPIVAAECVRNDRRSNVDDIFVLLSPRSSGLVLALLLVAT